MANPETPFNWPALLAELQKTNRAVRRQRNLIRLVIVLTIATALLAVLAVVANVRLNDTVNRAAEDRARIDRNVASIEASRAQQRIAVCTSTEETVNALFGLARPPDTVLEQWLEQARLDDFERHLETGLAPYACDLHLVPIPPPPAPAAPQRSTNAPAQHRIAAPPPSTGPLYTAPVQPAGPTPTDGTPTFVLGETFTRPATAAPPSIGIGDALCLRRNPRNGKIRPCKPNPPTPKP